MISTVTTNNYSYKKHAHQNTNFKATYKIMGVIKDGKLMPSNKANGVAQRLTEMLLDLDTKMSRRLSSLFPQYGAFRTKLQNQLTRHESNTFSYMPPAQTGHNRPISVYGYGSDVLVHQDKKRSLVFILTGKEARSVREAGENFKKANAFYDYGSYGRDDAIYFANKNYQEAIQKALLKQEDVQIQVQSVKGSQSLVPTEILFKNPPPRKPAQQRHIPPTDGKGQYLMEF